MENREFQYDQNQSVPTEETKSNNALTEAVSAKSPRYNIAMLLMKRFFLFCYPFASFIDKELLKMK